MKKVGVESSAGGMEAVIGVMLRGEVMNLGGRI